DLDRRAQAAPARSGHGHDPQDDSGTGGRGVRGRPRAHRRWAGRAFDPAGGLHDRRHRHDGERGPGGTRESHGRTRMNDMSDWRTHHSASILPALGRPQRLLVRGEGVHVWDETGKRYTDLLAGIAVNALGHAHPAIVEALTRQAGTLGHISNFFASPPQIALAERVLALAGAPEGSSVYFSNSGAEANEAALKITRRTSRSKIVAVEGSFHGRTMG